METYNGWDIYTDIPEGWWIDKSAGAPIGSHVFIVNGSPLKGGKRALLKLTNRAPIELNYAQSEVSRAAKKANEKMHKDAPMAMNRLARAKMKEKLLKDIRADLIICELEGWDRREYLNDLIELINHFK